MAGLSEHLMFWKNLDPNFLIAYHQISSLLHLGCDVRLILKPDLKGKW